MKILFVIFIAVVIIWPLVSWVWYYIADWNKWEKLFRRDVTNDTDLASSVGLKKFWNYNYCIRVGIEDYGVAFKPTILLLFHKSFCVPWIQILSYEYTPGHLTNVCLLRTTQGIIRIYGDVAEIVARGCEHHYVAPAKQ